MRSDTIHITDVAARDGLQNQPVFVATEDKLRLIDLLAAAGLRSVEATSFVSPKAVPQMGDAAVLLPQVRALHPQLRVSALVPNLKGFERACEAGAKEVAVVLSATETMNQKNINMGLEQASQVCTEVLRAAAAQGVRTRAYIAVAFECPFEGVTPIEAVLKATSRMLRAGAQEIVIADTIGAASPLQIRARFEALKDVASLDTLSAHFHDTRGMGIANAWAALDAGIRRFDASVGGIGGCPFAPGAAGNLATEDLVLLAHSAGLTTHVDLSGLLDAVAFAERLLQRPLGGRSMAWLRREHDKGRLLTPATPLELPLCTLAP